jgi:hypothetical protein
MKIGLNMSEEFENTVELDASEVDDALEDLEIVMENAETHLSHEEVRPSAHIMAVKARDAYDSLVEAHPFYELETPEE